jgi:AmmeMemoRadiSam system protein B
VPCACCPPARRPRRAIAPASPSRTCCRRLLLLRLQAIESQSHAGFSAYLAATHNTICGRHPIGVVLAALEQLDAGRAGSGRSHVIRFVEYAQSSRCTSPADSSVSYASAVVERVE